MWQYSSNVRIPGIRCRFDGNYLYEKDYTVQHKPKEIKSSKGKTVVGPWIPGSWNLPICSEDVLDYGERGRVTLGMNVRRSREPGSFLFLSK